MSKTHPRHRSPPRIGIALGSGGARGWAHVGVLQRLQEMGAPIACVAGTSVGAIVGAAYAAGRLDVLEDLSHRLDWRSVARLFVEVSFPRSGLINGRRVQQLLQDVVGAANIEDLSVPYAAVATDLLSEEPVVLRRGPLIDAIRASIAIPGIFVPARIGGRDLIDGGTTNPLPVDVARHLGADRVIAVDINLRPGKGGSASAREATPSRPPAPDVPAILARIGAHLPPLQGAVADIMEHWFRRKSADLTIFEVLTRSIRIAENQITRSRLLSHPPDVLIQPAVGDIDTLEFQRSAPAIEAGRAATDACAEDLRRLLAETNNPQRPDAPRRVRKPQRPGNTPDPRILSETGD